MAPASEPSLTEMVAAWRTITAAADPWLDTFTSQMLASTVISKGKTLATTHGNLLQRVIYHGSLPVLGGAALWAAVTNYVFIPREERALLEVFGDTYRDYVERTRRWL